MKKGGKGGAKTRTGKQFEESTDLRNILSRIKGISIRAENNANNSHIVNFLNEEIGYLYYQHGIYKYFLEPRRIYVENILSKKLLPDEAFLNKRENTLYVIEKKFQTVEGSVDEKLQTCVFKTHQYRKLLDPLKINLQYYYVLNSEWFDDEDRKKKYADTYEFVKHNGCDYFIDEIPLSRLGIKI